MWFHWLIQNNKFYEDKVCDGHIEVYVSWRSTEEHAVGPTKWLSSWSVETNWVTNPKTLYQTKNTRGTQRKHLSKVDTAERAPEDDFCGINFSAVFTNLFPNSQGDLYFTSSVKGLPLSSDKGWLPYLQCAFYFSMVTIKHFLLFSMKIFLILFEAHHTLSHLYPLIGVTKEWNLMCPHSFKNVKLARPG